MSFSENLKCALAQSGMTMTDLANSTGITYNMIKKYCAGNAEPTVSYALKMAEESDVVILAGKGHETYQEIRGVKHPFDEKVVVRELLEEL